MYRKHCDVINDMDELKLLVLDEGHRLKNILGTQTTHAFSSCRASRRLLLTGTPIQNNLGAVDTVYHSIIFFILSFSL